MLALAELLLLSSALLLPATCSPLERLRARNIVPSGSKIDDSYDFVIVGGGLAGLVLASRLSEDSNTTVLVLEAGKSGDDVIDQINTPANTYYHSLTGSEYDWQYTTAAQPSAGGRNLAWARGKVLGGSSAINGMYFVHPSKVEIDAWHGLIQDQDGSDSWSWDNFYSALKKAEKFGAPSDALKEQAGIQYTESSFGSNGGLHASYPGYSFDVVGSWTPTLSALGVPANGDAYSGNNVGSFVSTSSINPGNWTRSYSRSAYIDPLPPRDNLDILPQATVTRLVFDSSNNNNLTATGVEYTASSSSDKKTVKVKKEVLLAGGAIGSPQVLMVSGVGPKDVLSAAGVTVLNELPGVGQHLQDHLAAGLMFPTSADTMQAVHNSNNDASKTPEFNSFINSATAYVNASLLFDSVSDLQKDATDALNSAVSSLPSADSTVVEGFKARYNTIVNTFYPSDKVGQVEVLLTMVVQGSLMVQAAIQHPLSAGRLYIKTGSVFDAPIIDPQYLTHQSDVGIMRQGLKLARQVGGTAPLSNVINGAETAPGPQVSSDADWGTWLANNVKTEYHPSSTCSMLGKDKGGVVNAKLQVYGTANVRVVDSSVFPLSMSTHLGAPTFALAEQAASLIRSFYNGAASSGSTSTQPDASQAKPTGSGKNAGFTLEASSWRTFAVVAVMSVFGVFLS